jgi:carboxylesterase
VAVLLLHGFTGTPSCLRPVAMELSRRGHPVEAPLLAGHGTRLEDLMPVRHSDWTRQVDGAIRLLRAQGREVVVAGLSLGAILALQASLRHRDLLGLMLYAPPIAIRDSRRFLAPLLVRLLPTLAKPPDHFEDPLAARAMWGYDRYPTACSAQVLALIAHVRDQLHRVRTPTLVVASRRDRVVRPAGISLLQRRLPRGLTELHWLERSGHVITLDCEWPRVADLSASFLQRLAA